MAERDSRFRENNRAWLGWTLRDEIYAFVRQHFGLLIVTVLSTLVGTVWGFLKEHPLIWVSIGAVTLTLAAITGLAMIDGRKRRRRPTAQTPQIELQEVRVRPAQTGDPTLKTLYVQVLPKCSTPARIEDCRGHLLRVQKWDGARWVPTELNEPLDLIWSLHDSAPRILLPGIDQWLNVFWVSNVHQSMILQTAPVPMAAFSLLNFTDTFRFDIRVTGRDCAPADISLRVRIGNRWDVPEVIERL